MGWAPPPPPVLPAWLTPAQRQAVINLYRAELSRGRARQGGTAFYGLAIIAVLLGLAAGVFFR